METIASPANPRIKYVKRIQNDRRFRRREGLFAIEPQGKVARSFTPTCEPNRSAPSSHHFDFFILH